MAVGGRQDARSADDGYRGSGCGEREAPRGDACFRRAPLSASPEVLAPELRLITPVNGFPTKTCQNFFAGALLCHLSRSCRISDTSPERALTCPSLWALSDSQLESCDVTTRPVKTCTWPSDKNVSQDFFRLSLLSASPEVLTSELQTSTKLILVANARDGCSPWGRFHEPPARALKYLPPSLRI